MGSGGKTDSSAQVAQIQANKETLALIKEQTGVARRDVQKLFGSAQDNLLTGAQSGLDVFGQTIPQQFSTFQQGNVGAQQQLISGLPQVNNALLGLPTDLSSFQPQQINVDTSFAQQQLPQFTTPQQALALTPEEVAAQEAVKLEQSQLLAGQERIAALELQIAQFNQSQSRGSRTGGGRNGGNNQADRGGRDRSGRGSGNMGNAGDGQSDRSGFS